MRLIPHRLTASQFVVLACWTLASPVVHAQAKPVWPQWDDFAARFMQADGRVVDITFDRKSTSEGQSYALFLALVANRRQQFDLILTWTSDNLADGQLGNRLPAWLWGLREDGSWGVKDQNAASDADLWIAYSLFEAARLWKSPGYARTAHQLLALIRSSEIADSGRAGPVLLPAPVGFKLDGDRYRIDPSYLPGFMFRYFAGIDPKGPWQSVWDAYIRMAPKVFSKGIAPDLYVVDAAGTVSPDSEREPSGSYDAIRVYLWAGMSGPTDAALITLLEPYGDLVRKRGTPPEKVNPVTGLAIVSDYSPIGYSGALLPFLHATGGKATLERQLERIRKDAANPAHAKVSNYFDQVLILFGKGWLDGHYRFDELGRLHPRWSSGPS
ncbi:MAG: cellulase [Burkholderiales bacterium]|nr:cellulase [Burkholderiales bacterium]